MSSIDSTMGPMVKRVPSTLPQPDCPLCGEPGTNLYQDLRDQLYAVEGLWQLSKCQACGSAWLDPRPDDFQALYAEYYTHGTPKTSGWRRRLRQHLDNLSLTAGKMALGYPVNGSLPHRFIARLINTLRAGREMAAMRFAALPSPPDGRVLEIGCGDGTLLETLRQEGWEVAGIEADPGAVQAAKARGLDVTLGTVQSASLPPRAFRFVILNHVIEHVVDPIEDLRRCARLLTPGGRIVILTPNLAGYGHSKFHRYWRGLEVPRHLTIFTPASLQLAGEAAGLRVMKNETLIRAARFIYAQSIRIRHGGTNIERMHSHPFFQRIRLWLFGYAFITREWIAVSRNPTAGEEIFMHFGLNVSDS